MEKINLQKNNIFRKDLSFMASMILFLFINETDLAQYNITNAFLNLSFQNPVDIQHAGDNTNRLFVVSQTGVIHVFENDENAIESTEFLNITNHVLSGGEQGLLGLAFHPNYKSNGFFYVNYTANNPRRTVVSRFSVSQSDLNAADQNSEVVLLEVEQPYSNHNGGQITFGPDGCLYISLGDGGSGGDPQNNAQNLSSMLGKMLRINVDNKAAGKEYSIPTDNPFNNNSDSYAEEIYAYGLRNVWRFSFDSSGKLWAADVGQNEWEEVNLIENGGNYGWRIMEGFHCYNPSSGCDQTGLILPEFEYAHNSSGGYSITGGYVYEGNKIPSLKGKYIYADYVSGNIWAYDYSSKNIELLLNVNINISTFGVNAEKELFLADLISGKIYKIEEESTNSIESNNPTGFKLHQNYPNPFNPKTTIEYSIPYEELRPSKAGKHASTLRLDIFDVLGTKIKTLVNKNHLPGNYQTTFNALTEGRKIPSGVYFYKLQFGNFTETKKMILLN